MKANLYLGSTEVQASRSMAEVQQLLVRFGARRIVQEFDAAGSVSGMMFTIVTPEGVELPFKLPVRTQRLFDKIQASRKQRAGRERNVDVDRESALRIAWRQLLAWVKAQLAMIDTGMVEPVEVFMPYCLMKGGATLFEQHKAQKFKALPAPPESDE